MIEDRAEMQVSQGEGGEVIAAEDDVTVWGVRERGTIVVTVAGPGTNYRSIRTSRSIEYVLWALESDLPPRLREAVAAWLAGHGVEHGELRLTG